MLFVHIQILCGTIKFEFLISLLLLVYRKKTKNPRAGFKSKKIQPQEDSDEVPIITNIDDPWQEESEEDEKIGVSINAAGKSTELVVVENGVKGGEIHAEESKSSNAAGDSSPEVQVEAEIMPEMVALSVIAQQPDQDKTASGESSMLEGETEAKVESEEPQEEKEEEEEGGGEGAGTIEGPVVVIEESADPVMTVQIEVSCFGKSSFCVSMCYESDGGEREGEGEGEREREGEREGERGREKYM